MVVTGDRAAPATTTVAGDAVPTRAAVTATTTATGRIDRSTEVDVSQDCPNAGRTSSTPERAAIATARTRRAIWAEETVAWVARPSCASQNPARAAPPMRPPARTRRVGRISASIPRVSAAQPTRAYANASERLVCSDWAAAVNVQAARDAASTASSTWAGRRADDENVGGVGPA